MYAIELYANYALRDLLPQEMKQGLQTAALHPMKGNTLIATFSTKEERNQFASLCRTFSFSYRML